MEILEVIDNDQATVQILPDQRLIRLTWNGILSGSAYREQLLDVLDKINEHNLELLLIDSRRSGPVFFADQEWMRKEFIPQLADAGVIRHAVISSRDGMNLMVGLKKAKNVEKGEFKLSYFDNISMAMLWLLNNAKADVSHYIEQERIETLRHYRILDTEAQSSYDDITKIASFVTQAPIALISLVDSERQWFKSKVGVDVDQTSREVSFCSHAIKTPEMTFVVKDAKEDARFADNPLVVGDPRIRFYAGEPLVSPEGSAIGTLCVIDTEPRELNEQQHETLRSLARMVVMQLEYRRLVLEMHAAHEDLELYAGHLNGNKQYLEQVMERQLNFIIGGQLKDVRVAGKVNSNTN